MMGMFEWIGGTFSRLDLAFEELGLRKEERGRSFLMEVEEMLPKKPVSGLLLLFFCFMFMEREREREFKSCKKRGKRKKKSLFS